MSTAPKRPRFGGRQKGTPNKIPAAVREMISTALSNAGGVDYLVRQANEKPTAFLALIGRLIPHDVRVENRGLTLEELVGESSRLGENHDA